MTKTAASTSVYEKPIADYGVRSLSVPVAARIAGLSIEAFEGYAIGFGLLVSATASRKHRRIDLAALEEALNRRVSVDDYLRYGIANPFPIPGSVTAGWIREKRGYEALQI